MKKIRNEFNRLRKKNEYSALGWFFWNGFMLEKGKTRRLYQTLWASLTKAEKNSCEGI